MLTNTLDWQVMDNKDSATARLQEIFGERYGFTLKEREVFRLMMLFGLGDEDIRGIMQISYEELDNLFACMTGKTRTNSGRELQALFLRYILQKLPA
ncbi:hypothetical protein [Cohnella lupini]|uniref:Uncharacterized protein n=1 Tax=Cohnella lupini TaxID=1294267 RepID=A0A3D9I0L6_9BACL|nr:hypothetical protein [Cohnella lupini]RED54696.1 hypothetical protein DFP95_12221 [Cohnella lupini]